MDKWAKLVSLLSAYYIVAAGVSIALYGPYTLMLVLPLGGFLFGAFPASMLIFGATMLGLARTRGWKALPLTVAAGFMYDGFWRIHTVQPLTNYVLWVAVIAASLYVARPKVVLSKWLPVYLFTAFLLPQGGAPPVEYFTEALWVMAFWRSFR